MLSYAAMAGIALDDGDVKILANAAAEYRTAKDRSDYSGLNNSYADILLAYGRVAQRLLPLTTFTLVRFFSGFRRAIQVYFGWGVTLTVVVVVLSLLTFVSSTISESMKTEIDLANSKVTTLLSQPLEMSSQADDPRYVAYSRKDMLVDLQQLAISVRSIDGRARQLRFLTFSGNPDPFSAIRSDPEKMHEAFELDPKFVDPKGDFVRILGTFQKIRAYAQNLRDIVTFWYGGVTASILPILYAILGVCASSLRRLQVTMREKTFTDVGAKEHMLVAVIAGMLISLFSGLFASNGVSLSPLAWAFLAGYSSDAFFQVLDGVLRARTRTDSSSPAVPA